MPPPLTPAPDGTSTVANLADTEPLQAPPATVYPTPPLRGYLTVAIRRRLMLLSKRQASAWRANPTYRSESARLDLAGRFHTISRMKRAQEGKLAMSHLPEKISHEQ